MKGDFKSREEARIDLNADHIDVWSDDVYEGPYSMRLVAYDNDDQGWWTNNIFENPETGEVIIYQPRNEIPKIKLWP